MEYRVGKLYRCTSAETQSFVEGGLYECFTESGRIFLRSEKGNRINTGNGFLMSTFEEVEDKPVISKDKEYTTRGGREVRIYATDGGGKFPVHGAIKNPKGHWSSMEWDKNGLTYEDDEETNSTYDLIEKPKVVTRWVNVYRDCVGSILYMTEDEAYLGATATSVPKEIQITL